MKDDYASPRNLISQRNCIIQSVYITLYYYWPTKFTIIFSKILSTAQHFKSISNLSPFDSPRRVPSLPSLSIAARHSARCPHHPPLASDARESFSLRVCERDFRVKRALRETAAAAPCAPCPPEVAAQLGHSSTWRKVSALSFSPSKFGVSPSGLESSFTALLLLCCFFFLPTLYHFVSFPSSWMWYLYEHYTRFKWSAFGKFFIVAMDNSLRDKCFE